MKCTSLVFSLFLIVNLSCCRSFLQVASRSLLAYRSVALNARVALTREKGNNDQLRQILEKKNIDCAEVPCIAFAPGKDLNQLATEMTRCDVAVLSSPQAALVFLDCWQRSGKPSVKVSTVGKGTSKPLIAAGIQICFEPSDSTAETFAKELPITLGTRILYPTSALAENTMQHGLESRGFQVKRLNTYETVEAIWSSDELADAKDVDIVAFASPSAVRTWQSRCGSGYVAVTIGPTSAKAAEKFKLVISPKDSKGIEAWADLIIKAVDEFDSGVC